MKKQATDTEYMEQVKVREDVIHLNGLIEKLKKDIKAGTLTAEETRSRLEEVEAIARQLSLRVGLNH